MTAKTIANYMLYIMGDAFDDLTNTKLNKLLYFAQGHYLSEYGEPLFDDAIEAWEQGPVIPAVYEAYKLNGDEPMNGYDVPSPSEVPPEAEDILFGVARRYGKYTASALRNMTSIVDSPWSQVYEEGTEHMEIPVSSIRDYFATERLEPPAKQYKESDFVGYRDSDGVLVLPKDWDCEGD